MRVLHRRSAATWGDVATMGSGAGAAVLSRHGADDLALPPAITDVTEATSPTQYG